MEHCCSRRRERTLTHVHTCVGKHRQRLMQSSVAADFDVDVAHDGDCVRRPSSDCRSLKRVLRMPSERTMPVYETARPPFHPRDVVRTGRVERHSSGTAAPANAREPVEGPSRAPPALPTCAPNDPLGLSRLSPYGLTVSGFSCCPRHAPMAVREFRLPGACRLDGDEDAAAAFDRRCASAGMRPPGPPRCTTARAGYRPRG